MKPKKNLLFFIALLVLTSIATAQTLPTYVPASGLIGWWPFSGNANDISGNNNHGTVFGATLTKDRFNQTNNAYNFSYDSIIISNSNKFDLNKFTVSGWVNTTSTATYYQTLFNHSTGFGPYYGYWLGLLGPKASLYLANGTSEIDIKGNDNLNDGKWHFLTGAYNGTTGFIYVDGVLANSQSYTIVQKPCITEIGNDYAYDLFFGDLDDIGVWNRVLTQQEITDLFLGHKAEMKKVVSTNQVKIWPNPTNEGITINFDKTFDIKGCQVTIFNSVGQQVFQSTLSQHQFSSHLSNYGKSHYFANISDANGSVIETKKIVLQ